MKKAKPVWLKVFVALSLYHPNPDETWVSVLAVKQTRAEAEALIAFFNDGGDYQIEESEVTGLPVALLTEGR